MYGYGVHFHHLLCHILYIFYENVCTSVRCEFVPTLCLKLSTGSLLYTDLPVVIKLLILSLFRNLSKKTDSISHSYSNCIFTIVCS
jgi:hypothetical protein